MAAGQKINARSGIRRGQQTALAFFFLLIAGLVILVPSNPSSAAQSPVEEAKLLQKGRSLILQIKSNEKIQLDELERKPDFRETRHRYLCLQLNRRGGDRSVTRVCLGGREQTLHRVGVADTNRAGDVRSVRVIPAEITRPGDAELVATFDPQRAGLTPGRYDWRIAGHSRQCPPSGRPKAGASCLSHFPAEGSLEYDLRPVRIVGCTGGDGRYVNHGPRRFRKVALTFDDGPADFTGGILRVLRRARAKATFFMLGIQVERFPSYARRVLAQGHELANHSYNHDMLPSARDIHATNRRIKGVTGFRPCVFRPPYGAVDKSVMRAAARNRLKVVNWDVDTDDWRQPGAASITRSILKEVRPGSIVLMHDAGGPRAGTVHALADAIRGLRRRGFELVTVSELLGNRMLYSPVARQDRDSS